MLSINELQKFVGDSITIGSQNLLIEC